MSTWREAMTLGECFERAGDYRRALARFKRAHEGACTIGEERLAWSAIERCEAHLEGARAA